MYSPDPSGSRPGAIPVPSPSTSHVPGPGPSPAPAMAAATAAAYVGVVPFGMPGYVPWLPTIPATIPTLPALPSPPPVLPPASAPSRTVYLGNLPAEASVDELLSLVRYGPIDHVRLLSSKQIAFLSFLDPYTAAAFHADAVYARTLTLRGQRLTIGWGKPSTVSPAVASAVVSRGASRNVYIGNLPLDLVENPAAEQRLCDMLHTFGPIDQVKVVHDRRIAFVHFLSISTALKAVSSLSSDPDWSEQKINFGKDRCAYVPRAQQENQAHNHRSALAAAAQVTTWTRPVVTPASEEGQARLGYGAMMLLLQQGIGQMGNRTIYLGNIHPSTTTEELCNHIRGGILQSIKYLRDKQIAFVTFVDPNAAYAFWSAANAPSLPALSGTTTTGGGGMGSAGVAGAGRGIIIHSRRIKVGWGRPSGALSPAVAMSVRAGGSRNVYVGNIQDPERLGEDQLRDHFGAFGEFEQIKRLPEKNCAFVNFCSIQTAIRAVNEIKSHPDYADLRIAYGKDRCGNPPRTPTIHIHPVFPRGSSRDRSEDPSVREEPHSLSDTLSDKGSPASPPELCPLDSPPRTLSATSVGSSLAPEEEA